jgi:hypothetical protein
MYPGCVITRRKNQFSQNINFEKFFAFLAVKTQKKLCYVGGGQRLSG